MARQAIRWDDSHLIMRVQQGKKTQEIAQELGYSVSSVYNRLTSLRKQGKLPPAKRGRPWPSKST